MESFGKNLKKIRTDHHMSQKELGQHLGVGQTTIANYEKDMRFPNQEGLMRMADIFNITVDQLLGRGERQKTIELNDEQEFQKNLLDLLTHGKEREALERIKEMKIDNQVIIRLYEKVFKPLLYEVGILWEKGQLSIAKEHYISECIWRMVSYVSERIEHEVNVKGNVLCMVTSGEEHTLGIRMVADYFNMLGYRPYYIGGNIPTGEVVAFVEQVKPSFIALSLTNKSLNDALTNLIPRLNESCESCKIIVGGQAYAMNESLIPKQATQFINSFEDLENFLRSADGI